MTLPVPEPNLLDAVFGRPLTVTVTTAHERRLRANIIRANHDLVRFGDTPLDPFADTDLEIVLLATSDRGLHAGERDAGVWTDGGGHERPLPRDVRSPVWLRLRFACRAALTTWRST